MEKQDKKQKETLNKIIILAILAAALYGIVYVSNNTTIFRGETKLETRKNDAEEKVLDCAKKIALNEDLLKEDDESDCLFMGCGDFFR